MARGGRALLSSLLAIAASVLLVPKAFAGSPGCFGRAATIVGTPGDDVIQGTRERDVIVGREGDDVLIGLGKRDRLCGGSGRDDLIGDEGADRLGGGDDADHLFGGTKEDRLLGGAGNDVLVPGRGSDRADGGAGPADEISFLFASGIQVDLSSGRALGEGGDHLLGVEDVEGSDGRDRLTGDGRGNALEGGAGADRLRGQAGYDRLVGGPGPDVLVGGTAADVVTFGDSSSRVGVDLREGLARGEGNDEIVNVDDAAGSRFDDRLLGNGRENFLSGDLGDDVLRGRAGDDDLDAGLEGGTNYGGAGQDHCSPPGEGCEEASIADPASFPVIRRPRAGAVIPHERFGVVRGEIFPGITPPPHRVYVALRRFTERGCEWFSKRRGELVVGPCAQPIWNRATYDQDRGRWRLGLNTVLPSGRYLIGVTGAPGFGSRFDDSVEIRLR